MTIPQGIADLGVIAVALFLFVSAGWIAMKIIQALRHKPGENGNGKRIPCIQSPILTGIVSTQARMMDTVCKIEDGGDVIRENMVLQTKLMEQMGHVLERLSDCMIRQEANEVVRDRREGRR